MSGSRKATSNFTTHLKVGQYFDNDDERQIELTQSVVTFIARDLLPVSVVESGAFREFLEEAQPCFSMPSRKYL